VAAPLLGSSGWQAHSGDAGVAVRTMRHDATADWLRAWDSHGFHRTGTEGDEAGAAWLEREAAALGAAVTSEAFTLDRVDPVDAFVELAGQRIDAVPVFDAPAGAADGVTGRLGPAGSNAAIGVAELSPQAVYSGQYRSLRRDAAHRALVIVCQGSQRGLGLLNAEQFREPYGAPAIHVASDARDVVLAAAARGDHARLVANYCRTPTSARNIVATIPGRIAERQPVVVMTPRSSWWQSTSERGGGLVCWLEVLRALIASPPACNVVMTANSGHELGHLGLDEFMARRPGWERPDGAVWLHWGANIGAADGSLSVMSNSDELRTLACGALAEVGQAPDVLAPKTKVPSGETRDIHLAGGRYLTLVGSNPLFHLPQDRWPHSVDLLAVARIASAAARIVVALTR
jgi:hypothetical protein